MQTSIPIVYTQSHGTGPEVYMIKKHFEKKKRIDRFYAGIEPKHTRVKGTK